MPKTVEADEPMMVMTMRAYNELTAKIYALEDRVGTLASRNARLVEEFGRAQHIAQTLRDICGRAAG